MLEISFFFIEVISYSFLLPPPPPPVKVIKSLIISSSNTIDLGICQGLPCLPKAVSEFDPVVSGEELTPLSCSWAPLTQNNTSLSLLLKQPQELHALNICKAIEYPWAFKHFHHADSLATKGHFKRVPQHAK